MGIKHVALIGVLLLLGACANPLNKATYYRYLETGSQAEIARI
jgi:uncharacterized lipoprotein YmbA